MFKIKVIKQHTFNIVVKGYSKINSLIATVVDNTTKMVADFIMYVKMNTTVKDVTSFVIEKVKLITNPRIEIDTRQEKINATFSSKEKISDDVITGNTILDGIIRSKENISDRLIDTLKIIADAKVGYFKKLYEFDNLTLAELDILTVEEMDYVLMLMASENEKVVM